VIGLKLVLTGNIFFIMNAKLPKLRIERKIIMIAFARSKVLYFK